MTYSTNQHAEWLSLIEVSGPFLAEPILNQAFPQGLEKVDPVKKKQFRQTYDEWREVSDSDVLQDIQIKDKIHQEWVNWVLKIGLELDEDEDGDTLKNQSQMNDGIQVVVPEHHVTIKPEYVVIGDDETQPYMLVQTYPAGTALSEVLRGDGWSTSPAERMAHLCRGVGTRLGLITNGEQWMFIDAPIGGITTYASWFARLWGLEPVTLKAFYSLFNIKIVYSGFDDNKTLPQLVDESLTHQGDVTQALGSQVSRAVEVLIQSIDRINHDHNGELLEGVEPEELYEAGLTLMMRLVFLLCAEERGLLLLGDQAYEANYALSTLRAKLREEASLHGDEVLSYRKNAWARLLAIFRSVYAGVEHENMRMPALGGSLFDPDRFPFLEGRGKGSNWIEDEAKPLPIDNRTVLLFLDAIQLYKGRTLSYRALDVEQIGYVYEGLLEQTVKRAPDVTLELSGSKNCKKPWVYLGELASASLDGEPAVKNLLKERTASSASRITNDLTKEVTDADVDKLLVACYNDDELCQRIKPYYHFLRFDAWGNPLLYPKHSYMLTSGSDRRETGSHYTPKSLTESIVTETLEPVVYIGPAEGKPRDEWQLKSPESLLDLKICDPAMGSGAFLVQVCRWLAERVCESWLSAEKSGAFVTVQGITTPDDTQELIPVDAEERLIIAKRLISERCLYGVDINPLAVELAKLSLWLITLSRDRPFGFLDHNLKSGDSLLGIHNLDQLCYLNLNLNQSQTKKSKLVEQPFTKLIKELVAETLELRKKIAIHDINLVSDIDEMTQLEEQAREKILIPKLIADVLIEITLESGGKIRDISALSSHVHQALNGNEEAIDALQKIRVKNLNNHSTKPFHWCIEFPEVFLNGSFDCLIGNPPFLGNKNWKSAFGPLMQRKVELVLNSKAGKIDLSLVFHRRTLTLLKENGCYGLLSTSGITRGGAIAVGLGYILKYGEIYSAEKMVNWPGDAGVHISKVIFRKGAYLGSKVVDGISCENISSRLTEDIGELWEPKKLVSSLFGFEGVHNSRGLDFLLEENTNTFNSLNDEPRSLVQPYVTGNDLTSFGLLKINRFALDILDRDLYDIKEGWPKAYEFLISSVAPSRTESELTSYKGLIDRWWQFWNHRAKQYKEVRKHDSVIVFSKNTKYPISFRSPSSWIHTNKMVVIKNDKPENYAICLSTFFQKWLEIFGGGLRSTLTINLSKSVYTFPIPVKEISQKAIDAATLWEKRAKSWCLESGKGITELMNQYHSASNNEDAIVELRELLEIIDQGVLNAFEWGDIKLEYKHIELPGLIENESSRYTWPTALSNQLVNSLLMENKARYEAEQE
jgi:hypothetical protein